MRTRLPAHSSARRPVRGFTLIELLIVVAIIGILATLLLSAIFGAKTRTQIGVAKSQIRAIQAALAMYEGDEGKLPRHAPRPTAIDTPPASMNDDAPALYAALRNRSTVALGGGKGSPYLDWKAEFVGKLAAAKVTCTTMSGNSYPDHGIVPLNEQEQTRVNLPDFQDDYPIGTGATPPGDTLVFLDPWGNPYHYREWSSVRASVKDSIMGAPVNRAGSVTLPPVSDRVGDAPVTVMPDTCHTPEAYDIWSNGPNGVNEYGAPGSDDITSWSR